MDQWDHPQGIWDPVLTDLHQAMIWVECTLIWMMQVHIMDQDLKDQMDLHQELIWMVMVCHLLLQVIWDQDQTDQWDHLQVIWDQDQTDQWDHLQAIWDQVDQAANQGLWTVDQVLWDQAASQDLWMADQVGRIHYLDQVHHHHRTEDLHQMDHQWETWMATVCHHPLQVIWDHHLQEWKVWTKCILTWMTLDIIMAQGQKVTCHHHLKEIWGRLMCHHPLQMILVTT